ncbi:MAG: hypothetical protein ACE5ES_04700 [Candidatus Nanoarchaeia archaeon]
METNPLHPVDKGHLVEIDGDYYVPRSEREGLISPESFVPIYFTSTQENVILHDTPVMGAMARGAGTRRVFGPFLSTEESERLIEEKKESVDHVRYFFSGQIHLLLIPEQDFSGLESLNVYRYSYGSYSFGPDIGISHFYGDSDSKGPTTEQFHRFFDIMSEILLSDSEDEIGEIGENHRSLISRLGNSLISISLSYGSFPRYSASTFGLSGETPRNFSRDRLDTITLIKLNMNLMSILHWEEITNTSEYASLSSPDELIGLMSIDDILKSGNLI